MRRGRRLAAAGACVALEAAGVAGLLGVGVTAAVADSSLTGLITSPTSSSPLTAPGWALAGSFQISGTSPTIDQVTLSVTPEAGQPIPGAAITWCQGTSNGCGQSSVTFSWTVPPLSYNGAYRADAEATGTEHQLGGTTPHSGSAATVHFKLAIPPAVPRGLTEVTDTKARTVKLTWNRNVEPDTAGYYVQREGPSDSQYTVLPNGGVYQPPAGVQTVSLTDTSVPRPGGTYRYQVFALRGGADPGSLVASTMPATTTAALPEAPAPPTTAGAGTGGGSGSATTTPSPVVVSPGAADGNQFRALRPTVALPSRPATTPDAEPPDTGYKQRLPYQSPTVTELVPEQAAPSSRPVTTVRRVLNQRALLTSIAIAAMVFVFAFQIRWLAKTVGPPAGPPS